MSASEDPRDKVARHPARKTLEHLERLYLALRSEADRDGVYRGSKAVAFRKTGASAAWYTKLYNLLIQMGCVEQVEIGTSTSPSVLRLIKAPTRDDFEKIEVDERGKMLTENPTRAMLHSRLTSVERRLPSIDLAEYIQSLEARLTDLNDRVSKLEGKGLV